MANNATSTITLIVDSRGAVKGIKDVNGVAVQFDRTLDQSSRKVSSYGNKLKVALGAVAVGAAAAATQALSRLARLGFDVLADSVRKAGIQDIAERKLAQAIENTGESAEVALPKLKAVAAEMQNISNFGDEAIITAQAMLLSFREVGGPRGAELLTRNLVDTAAGLAKVTGQTVDLNNVAGLMGRALTQGAGALTEAKVSLNEAEKAAFDAAEGMDRVRLLSEILDSNFTGLAEATADPFVQLEMAVGDLQEVLGKELLPVARELATEIKLLAQEKETIEAVGDISKDLADVFRLLIQVARFLIEPISDYIEAQKASMATTKLFVANFIVGWTQILRTSAHISRGLSLFNGTLDTTADMLDAVANKIDDVAIAWRESALEDLGVDLGASDEDSSGDRGGLTTGGGGNNPPTEEQAERIEKIARLLSVQGQAFADAREDAKRFSDVLFEMPEILDPADVQLRQLSEDMQELAEQTISTTDHMASSFNEISATMQRVFAEEAPFALGIFMDEMARAVANGDNALQAFAQIASSVMADVLRSIARTLIAKAGAMAALQQWGRAGRLTLAAGALYAGAAAIERIGSGASGNASASVGQVFSGSSSLNASDAVSVIAPKANPNEGLRDVSGSVDVSVQDITIDGDKLRIALSATEARLNAVKPKR